MTVLIIEDNEDSRRLFQKRLRASGHLTQIAGNGKEGLEVLNTSSPDLVLLDLELPDTSGFDIVAKIRETPEWASLVVVACTAQAMAGDKERALAAGFDAYLSKPIDIRALPQRLEEILHGNRP